MNHKLNESRAETMSHSRNCRCLRIFTLIELLVVVAIVGILASGLMAVINPAARIGQARDAQRKSDLHQIQTALEAYYNDNGDNDRYYVAIDKITKILGWTFFGSALVLDLFLFHTAQWD